MSRIAYLVLAHRDAPLVIRVARKLVTGTHNHVFIHVDAKVDISPFEELEEMADGHIHIIENRQRVTWGGYSAIKATITLMESAIGIGEFDYYQILQGSDYPIASNKEISDYLDANKGKEFIKAVCEEDSTQNRDRHKYCLHWRLDSTTNPFRIMENNITKLLWRLIRNSSFLVPVPRIYDGERYMIIYRGWAQFCLSEETVRYILDYYYNHPKFIKFFKHVYAPDESFFHTIIFNNEELAKRTIAGGALSDADRSIKSMLNLTYFEYPTVVRVFKNVSEWPVLRDSGYLYFRKASSSESSELLDYIDSLHESEE